MEKSKALRMIEEYLLEPNNISKEWVEVLELCKKVLLGNKLGCGDMTDSEITKTLIGCAESVLGEPFCDKCAYLSCEECGVRLAKDAIDLINRKNAMIKMLNTNCENLQLKYENAVNEAKFLKRQLKIARTEAIKEFANEFVCSISGIFHCVNMQIIREKIDALVKQRTEGNK